MSIAHGDEAVVELVFVVAFDHKTVLNCLLTIHEGALRDNGNRESIDLADTLVLTVGVGTLCQSLQMNTHVLLIGQVAGVEGEIVERITVLVSPDDCLVPCDISLHPFDCRLVVGNVVGDGLVSELGIGNALVVRLALTLQRGYAFFEFRLFQQVGIARQDSHVLREVHAVFLIHSSFVDSSRAECAGFELVDECSLAMEKVELI